MPALWLTMPIVLSLNFIEAPASQRGSLKDRADTAKLAWPHRQLRSPSLRSAAAWLARIDPLRGAGILRAGPAHCWVYQGWTEPQARRTQEQHARCAAGLALHKDTRLYRAPSWKRSRFLVGFRQV